MIYDKENQTAHNCKYRIGLASKFLKNSLTKNGLQELVENTELPNGMLIEDLVVKENIILFNVAIAPSISVVTSVRKIKKKLEQLLVEEKIYKDTPIFSSSFYCTSIECSGDYNEYLNKIKKNYREKRGIFL